MKLEELNIPKTRSEAIIHLSNFGWDEIGVGSFASVLAHKDKDYVLKLFSAKDKPYMKFVELALSHQDNPHFPKFRRGVIRVSPGFNAIRMEKLKPYNGTELCERIDSAIEAMTDAYERTPKKKWDEFNNDIKAMGRRVARVGEKLTDAMMLIARTICSNTNFRNDIHDKNIMWRGKTLVITDPLYNPRL